jgi:glycine/D-amino acid oxidase-like deaminating enzyme
MIGGGIIGASTVYHLAVNGGDDVRWDASSAAPAGTASAAPVGIGLTADAAEVLARALGVEAQSG